MRVTARLRVGDLFTIPINAERVAVGQLVDKVMTAWYVVVFEATQQSGAPINTDEVLRSRIRLQAITSHSRIHHGYWKVVGHVGVDATRIKWPEFKTMTPDTYMVIDIRGEAIREASWLDRLRLKNWTSFSPMIIEDAAKSLFGAGEWDSRWDDILAPGARRPRAASPSSDIGRR